ncbi:hypothetical protein TRICI_005894 [Trichomonascus ciferrii]|uniref:GDS1 winged helix domain-containing protein n=1 Tax=Trichomonascus ciferrii TaxID=44093 RepID=A0A642UP11_9ASCO|nr:hypothetical protein TRICI_005894 [Trichomonascus ciferrii]
MAVTISNDEELINSCIELLKEYHPSGLTIKQMAEKLLTNKNALCRSSTVLSTKLNSYYRRCDESCPIIRLQCPDVPNRLMYKYNDGKSRPLSPPPTENDPKDDLPSKNNKSVADYIQRPISPPSPPGSTTGGSQSSSSSSSGYTPTHNYSLRKVIKKTPHAFTPPTRRSSTAAASTASKNNNANNKATAALAELRKNETNPYYDLIYPNIDVNSWSWINDETLENINSPENVSIDDLDELL